MKQLALTFIIIGVSLLMGIKHLTSKGLLNSRTLASTSSICSNINYQVRIFSIDPLVLYLIDFLSEDESRYLLDISAGSFSESQRVDLTNRVAGGVDKSFRSSQTAFLKEDVTTQCIKDRALSLQSHITSAKVESLQIVKYAQNDYVRNHYDWFTEETVEELDRPGRRDSTIFAYVQANCTGGGTNFPRLRRHLDATDEWCRYVECNNRTFEGVTFKAISRNAVFWQNWDSSNRPRPDVLHSGLPVTSGLKVGLNIWTSVPRTKSKPST